MKKLLFILLVLVLTPGCENLTVDSSGGNLALETYEIGKMHNEVLAYYYQKSNPYLKNEEILSVIEDYLIYERNYDLELVREGTKQIVSSPEYS
jgi:hypothetical protein